MSVVESILRKFLDKIIEELQYKHAQISLKQLTSGGANYTSALYSATVTAPDRDSLKLFAKVANISGYLREAMNLAILFKTEQFVYSDLAKVYEKIQDKHNVCPEHRFVFPKYYGSDLTDEEEIVVMEDLKAKGYEMYSRFESIDWEHAASAVKTLATFHALSLAYRKEDPENFAKDAEKLKYKMKEKLEDPKSMEIWKKMLEAAVQVTKEEHRERLAKVLFTGNIRDTFSKVKTPLSTPVLCHGDYRISNLLFRRQSGRLASIAVDYQTVHTGCPAIDLLYFEFMGTDEQFRRENHERLVDHYFKELTAALDRVGVDVNEVYPRETFDRELKEMLGSALCMATIILPMVLVEAQNAPNLGNASSVGVFALSPTELFAERFSAIVSDCIRWEGI